MKSHTDNLRTRQIMLEKQAQETQIRKPMEAPVIVKSINRGITDMRTDAYNQAVQKTPQTVSNRQAYDIMYPDHKSYYEDKKFFVFDGDYNRMENALINTFEKAVDEGLGDNTVKALGNGKINNIKHVDEIKDGKINVNFGQIPAVIIFSINFNSYI